MKKIIVVSLLLMLTNITIFAKDFNYDGISFKYSKGWSFNYNQQNDVTTIFGFKEGSFIQITKSIKPPNVDMESYLENTAESIMEKNYSSSKKVKLKSKSSITNRDVNGIEARSVDFVFTNKVRQRIYCIEIANYMITITLKGPDKKYDSQFSEILKSFRFQL